MHSRLRIISIDVDSIGFKESLDHVMTWGLNHESGFICFANVHMTIEAHQDPAFSRDLQKARLILPDGKPIAWCCRWLYHRKQERIAGMDYLPALIARANEAGAKVFLYGSTPDVLNKLIKTITTRYPNVSIAGSISPPFRALTSAEIADHVDQINRSGAHFVLLALGCPKQEKWMAARFESIPAILLGLGGAFPVLAGIQKRSPVWMQRGGMEWLYRLLQEPRRLLKRYVYTNTQFAFLLVKEMISGKDRRQE